MGVRLWTSTNTKTLEGSFFLLISVVAIYYPFIQIIHPNYLYHVRNYSKLILIIVTVLDIFNWFSSYGRRNNKLIR